MSTPVYHELCFQQNCYNTYFQGLPDQLLNLGVRYDIESPIDEEKMRSAARRFLGTHDFAAFQASGGTAKSTIRTIYGLDIDRQGDDITLTVRGNAFLYNMVRIMAGTLIAVGQDRLSADCVDEALETGNRLVLGVTAPPNGLELTRIFYDLEGEEPPDDMR